MKAPKVDGVDIFPRVPQGMTMSEEQHKELGERPKLRRRLTPPQLV